MLDILETVSEWIRAGSPVALATVIQTWGSSPRREGAKMAVTSDARLVGSVSGGCVEGAVVEAAGEVLASGTPQRLHFGVSDDSAWSVGLSCGGEIDVWVEPLAPERWKSMEEAYRQDRETVFLSTLDPTEERISLLLEEGRICWSETPSDDRSAALLQSVQGDLEQGRSGLVTIEGRDVLIDREAGRLKLIIVGGAHVARTLSKMAVLLGYRVILIDPRRVFASTDRFPEVREIYHDYPDRILPQLGLDASSAVVVLTHDPKIDDPALITALASSVNYVGVLSSKKTHRTRLERLRSAGVQEAALARIRVPIGLDLGGRLPEEIALAILAEITAVRHGKTLVTHNLQVTTRES